MLKAVLAAVLALFGASAFALAPTINIDDLPRLPEPQRETGNVVPAQVVRWRQEAVALEYGANGMTRDELRAAELYCRASRYGDAESQYNLGWMYTNSRGIERNDAYAAHLFAAAAEQGMAQAQNMAQRLGTPVGDPPPCLRSPDDDPPPVHAKGRRGAPARVAGVGPVPANAPAVIVNFVRVVAPEYKLEPWLVLAIMATESNFNPWAKSPADAHGLMQLIPGTAARFNVRNIMDPSQNIRGGMAYLRWLMAYYEGDIALVAAAYNAGEGAVERYRGVPPYAETRNYVRKILARVGGRRLHDYDPQVTAPSKLALMIRGALSR